MVPSTHHDQTRAASLFRRSALALMLLFGVFLIVFPIATGMFGKTVAARDLMSALRPTMTQSAVNQGSQDILTLQAMNQELKQKALPALAAQLKLTPAQLSQQLATAYTDVGTGLAQSDRILAAAAAGQNAQAAQQSNFQQADQIPTSFLPPTSLPWLFVGIGLIVTGVAAFGLIRRTRVAAMLAGLTLVGVVTAVGLLATTMYSKAPAADDVTTAFQPYFTAQSVQQARQDTAVLTAMATQLQQQVIPSLAISLHLSPAQLQQLMGTVAPNVNKGLSQLPSILARSTTLTDIRESQLDNFARTDSIPWSPGTMTGVYWALMAPALAIMLIGAAALITVRPMPLPRFGGLRHGPVAH